MLSDEIDEKDDIASSIVFKTYIAVFQNFVSLADARIHRSTQQNHKLIAGTEADNFCGTVAN